MQAKNCNFEMRHMLDGSRIQRSQLICRMCAFMFGDRSSLCCYMPAMFVTDSVNNHCEWLSSHMDFVCEFVYRCQQHFAIVFFFKIIAFLMVLVLISIVM